MERSIRLPFKRVLTTWGVPCDLGCLGPKSRKDPGGVVKIHCEKETKGNITSPEGWPTVLRLARLMPMLGLGIGTRSQLPLRACDASGCSPGSDRSNLSLGLI